MNIQHVQESLLEIDSNVLLLPVPARIRKSKDLDGTVLPQVADVLSTYSMSRERYKMFSDEKSDYYKGQIEAYTDADLSGIDIEGQESTAEEIAQYLEDNTKIIIIFPYASREDKGVREDVLLSSFRVLQNMLNDDEFSRMTESVAIPSFPVLEDVEEKVNQMFETTGKSLFVCHGSESEI